jgi:hypothetical protein
MITKQSTLGTVKIYILILAFWGENLLVFRLHLSRNAMEFNCEKLSGWLLFLAQGI